MKNLRNIIIEKGYSVASLAEKIGVSPQCLIFLCNGKTKKPQDHTLFELHKILELPVQEILNIIGGKRENGRL